MTIRLDQSHCVDARNITVETQTLRSWLTIVVPAKNEGVNLAQLISQIITTFRPLTGIRPGKPQLLGFEIIVVDDGSVDSTTEVLLELMVAYRELHLIRLDATCGQSVATLVGIRQARGEWIGLIDADLQNDPNDLAKLWDKLPGYDAALGWRTKREDSPSKRLISRYANRFRNLILGQSIKDTGCSLRILPREIVLRLPAFQGMHRFFGPLLLREGCRIIQVPVSHRPRIHGKSHYTIWNRSLQVIIDLLGVAWLMHRPVHCKMVSLGRNATPPPHLGSSESSIKPSRMSQRDFL